MSVSVFHQMLYDLAGGTATSDKIEGHNLSQKVVVTNLVSPSVGVFQMLYLVFGKLCFLFETVYLVIGKAYLVYISVKTSRITWYRLLQGFGTAPFERSKRKPKFVGAYFTYKSYNTGSRLSVRHPNILVYTFYRTADKFMFPVTGICLNG